MQNGIELLDGVDTVLVDKSEKAHQLEEYNCRLSSAHGGEALQQHTSVTVRLSVYKGILDAHIGTSLSHTTHTHTLSHA